MKFKEITEKSYRNFWEHSPEKCFMSAPEIGKLNPDAVVYYLGLEKGGRLVAAIMVRGLRRWPFGYDFYAPRGPLLDYSDSKTLKFFMGKCRDFLQLAGGYVLRIDPNLPLLERDIDGRPVSGGFNHSSVVDNLLSLGFKKRPYVENISQITWSFVLPVAGKTEEELLSNMKPNTRRRLKQALDLGIRTKTLNYDELPEFYEILLATGSRKDFPVRDFEYFQTMYRLFGPSGVKYISAVINPKESLDNLQLKLATARTESPKTIREKRDHADLIKSLETRIKRLTQLFPESDDREITLSSGMFMTLKPEILHLFGGNVSEYLKLDGQYVLQWEIIRQALNNGYNRYNFYGIPEHVDTLKPGSKGYGVYEFKRGFSGHVEQLIGEYELPLSKPRYFANKLASKLRRLL